MLTAAGHGRSTNTQKETSFHLMAEDLATIMEQEGLNHADLLGFSDGANLAMVFARLFPEKVDHLVLNAGNTVPSGVRTLYHLLSYVQYAIVWIGAFVDTGMRNFLPILRLLFRDIGLTTEDLNQIQAPTLVIVGKHDSIKRNIQCILLVRFQTRVLQSFQDKDICSRVEIQSVSIKKSFNFNW